VPKRSIIISAGKESNCDSVSNGERKRIRSNRIPWRNSREMWSVDSCQASAGKLNLSGKLDHRG
jgi:hypothetical protein